MQDGFRRIELALEHHGIKRTNAARIVKDQLDPNDIQKQNLKILGK